jgi:hypothetical protein
MQSSLCKYFQLILSPFFAVNETHIQENFILLDLAETFFGLSCKPFYIIVSITMDKNNSSTFVFLFTA